MPRLAIARTLSLSCCLAILAASCGRSLTGSVTPHTDATRAPALADASPEHGSVLVAVLRPGADARDLVSTCGGELVDSEDAEGVVSLRCGPEQVEDDYIAELSGDLRVLAVEPEQAFEAAEARQRSFAFDDGFGSATSFAEQPAARAVGLDRAHAASLGDGVTIAILDTGGDLDHPGLRSAIAGGWDFVDRDADPREYANGIDDDGDGFVDEAHGHGTHVAGIAHLVAPRARLLVVRVLDDEGRGSLLHVAAGVRWAVSHGAQVINLSLGSLRASPALEQALAEAEASGVLAVVSAGNGGGPTPVEFPASSSHALAVAAVDTAGQAASFTSRGPHVAIAAPGVGVRSTYPGGGYRLWSGTSMSAPFVTGSAALLAALHPGWAPGELRLHLGMTAHPIPGAPMHGLGAGWLDAGSAVAPALLLGDPATEGARPR